MATNNFTTRTASLRATKIDTTKIILKGKNILDYITESKTRVLDDRGEFVTENDLWGTSVTTDENGVVHVSHKYLSNPNGFNAWNSSVKSVKDNKAYTSTTPTGEPLCNIQTEMIKNANGMFYKTSLESFRSDLSNLVDGTRMFAYSSLKSFNGDLSSLFNGTYMFQKTSLESFSADLSSLEHGYYMFAYSSLKSFNGDLSSLGDGQSMFKATPLESFSGDLSSLTNGESMFFGTPLTSFNGDLSSLTNGESMFSETSLTSFNGDLSSLTNGLGMFSRTHKRGYTISYYKTVDGAITEVTEHVRAEGLTSFIGDLGSLQSGYNMFGDGREDTYTNEEGISETTKNITPLNEQSVMLIADTITDFNKFNFSDLDSSISGPYLGIIHIGYDSEVCDAANIEEYCTEIMNKGWTVYLNGTQQDAYPGIEGIATTDEDGTITVTPIPYYCKPLEVEQKKAEWTDGEKYYIILGAQKVFGDDLSSYGMFTSIENAAMNMGFTPYKYVEEEAQA